MLDNNDSNNIDNNDSNNVVDQEIFTKSSIDKIKGPEELNDYVRVTTPSVWVVLIAIAFFVIGLLGWSIFGTLRVHEADGSTTEVAPITYVIN